MSERIQGEVQTVRKNDYGFWSVKVDDVWYGAGKGNPGVEEGDEVEFGAYENDKGFMTVKGKIKGGSGPSTSSSSGGSKFKGKPSAGAKKPAVDWDAKDARIAYQGAHKIAVTEVDLALRNGAIKLPSKQTDILEAIQALVDETANRIFGLSYAAKQPEKVLVKAKAAKVAAEGDEDDDAAEDGDGWDGDEAE